MLRTLCLGLFLIALGIGCAFASPKEIIIIRHADKLDQPEPGPALSAKGQVRAVKFAFYYLKKFGAPGYIIAAYPVAISGKGSSIRELQTVAPLVNILSAKHADVGYPLLHPYSNSEYAKLAEALLHNSRFDGETILVCWDHTKINALTWALGVRHTLPEWKADDYDTVYVLKLNKEGAISDFTMLHEQYPVTFHGTWDELLK